MRKDTGIKLDDAIKKAREGEKKKFTQTVDLIINLRNIDLKKPENKFSKDILLPNGRGKDVSVCIISDTMKDGICCKAVYQEIRLLSVRSASHASRR